MCSSTAFTSYALPGWGDAAAERRDAQGKGVGCGLTATSMRTVG
jgi:hypothetical protein